MKKKEKELQAKEVELRRREQVLCAWYNFHTLAYEIIYYFLKFEHYEGIWNCYD